MDASVVFGMNLSLRMMERYEDVSQWLARSTASTLAIWIVDGISKLYLLPNSRGNGENEVFAASLRHRHPSISDIHHHETSHSSRRKGIGE